MCLTLALSLIHTPEAKAYGYYDYYGYYGYSEVDAAIDYVGLPYVFHDIAWRESGDDPYAVNPYSGACSAFQFLPSTAANIITPSHPYGYNCYELTDPYVAAEAAYALWWDYGLSPWRLTAY